MKNETVIVNTIGLTGAEILASFLARMPEIKVLPGTNFMWFDDCLYRKHEVEKLNAEKLFSIYSRQLHEKDNRLWAGITRFMSEPEKTQYQLEKHKNSFVQGFASLNKEAQADFFAVAKVFIESYFSSQAIDMKGAKYVAFCGKNFLINLGAEDFLKETPYWINISNRPDTWLAMISRRLTWNPIESLKFYLAHSLYISWKVKQDKRVSGRFLNVYLEDLIKDQKQTLSRISDFLNCSGDLSQARAPGSLPFSQPVIEDVFALAKDIRAVYKDLPLYQLTESLPQWSEQFVSHPKAQLLMKRFETYWNSTSHTSFDWAGPLEEEIMDLAFEVNKVQKLALGPQAGTSAYFYHNYFDLTSEKYEQPECRLRHCVGSLEEEIVLPLSPYFVRCVVAYYKNICELYTKIPHSYKDLRKQSLYQRMTETVAKDRLVSIRLGTLLDELELAIDRAEASVRARDKIHRYLYEPNKEIL